MSRWPKPQHDDHCWLIWCATPHKIMGITHGPEFHLTNATHETWATIFWPAYNFKHYAQEARAMLDKAYPLIGVEFATRDPYYKGKPYKWLISWLKHYSNAARAYHELSLVGDDERRSSYQQTAANCAWLALGFRLELVARGRPK